MPNQLPRVTSLQSLSTARVLQDLERAGHSGTADTSMINTRKENNNIATLDEETLTDYLDSHVEEIVR